MLLNLEAAAAATHQPSLKNSNCASLLPYPQPTRASVLYQNYTTLLLLYPGLTSSSGVFLAHQAPSAAQQTAHKEHCRRKHMPGQRVACSDVCTHMGGSTSGLAG